MRDWDDTLSALEQRLAEQEAAVADGAVDGFAAFTPPEGLGELPAPLAARARELVWRCRALEDRIAAALTRAQDKLDRLSATAPATPPAQPVFFDSRV